MASYKDLPSAVEKYSLTPYLSGSDVASLLLVDRKRRDLYNLKYWNKRLKDEEGISLPNYEDKLGPYVRYIKAKGFLEAKRRFESSVKELSYYYDGAPGEEKEIPALIEKEFYDSFTTMIKYAALTEASSIVKQIVKIKKGLYDHPLFDQAWPIIAQCGSPQFIKTAFSFASSQNINTEEVMNEMLSVILLKGRIDVLQSLEVSKDDIMSTLILDDIDMSEENLIILLDYTSKLLGGIRNNRSYYLTPDKRPLIGLLRKCYPSLLPQKLGFSRY